MLAACCILAFFTPPTVARSVGDDLALVLREQTQRVATFAAAAKSVVLIYPNAAREGGGSGVLIDADGYGVTNFHVVAEFVGQGGYGALSDGKLYPLTVLGIDPGGDVAMFKLEGRDEFPFAPFGPKSDPHLGQTVAAMGNPFVLSENYDPTISMGVISGLHRYQEGQENLLEYADCIQVSTSINPGNSGGPLFDLDGHVIGINGRASFEERGRVNVGLGYAITTRQIERFIPALRAGLLTQHGTLGATVQLAGDDLIVDAIQQLSPAEKAGIEIGDVIVAIDGQVVKTPNEFNNVVAPMPADWPVTVTLQRANEKVDVIARLEALPIRMQTPFLPDTRLQHDAVRRYFAKFRAANGNQRRKKIEISGQVQLGEPQPFSISLGDDDASFSSDEAAGRLAAEFMDIVRPLLVQADIGFGWTILGGDKIDGRIVGIVQYGAENGEKTKWYFDDATHAVVQVCVQSGEDSVVCWRPVIVDSDDVAAFPRLWRRISENESVLVEIVEIRREE